MQTENVSRSLSPTPRPPRRYGPSRRHSGAVVDAKPKKVSIIRLVVISIMAFFAMQMIVSWRFIYKIKTATNYARSGSSSFSRETHPSWRTMQHDVPSRIDGTFNGAPLQLMTLEKPATRIHCVGDNYQYDDTDWLQRSCYFHFFCFNTTTRRYVVFQSTPEQSLSRILMHTRFFHIATIMSAAPNVSQTVSIGGINQKWGGRNIPRLRWFPDIVNVTNTSSPVEFYALPSSVVLLPYHSLNGANPGHAVWDDFMSLYTLLDMFDLVSLEPLLMRYILEDGQRGMWASCDFRDDKVAACAKILDKFSPMMMGTSNGYHWSTTQSFDFRPNQQQQQQQAAPTDLVCAAHGAAGIGSLTDHGVFKVKFLDCRHKVLFADTNSCRLFRSCYL